MKIHQFKIDFNVTPQISRYVFVYIIEGANLYMIDSGVAGSETKIEDFLHSIGRNVNELKGIFLTHAHPDHIGTAAYFKKKTGCKVYASEGERAWIENIDTQYSERPIPNFYALAGSCVCVYFSCFFLSSAASAFLFANFTAFAVWMPKKQQCHHSGNESE